MAQSVVSRDLRVPDGPDDVTADWLTEALRSTGASAAVRIRGLDVEPLPDGRGFLGRMARLRLHVDGVPRDTPAALIAKFTPADPDRRATVRRWFAREVRFYGELAGAAPVRTPRCYYGAVDEASGGSVLLLEDLTALRSGDPVSGCRLEDAVLAVQQLARFHARWWEQPRLGA
jgi:hypothetical protein